MLDLTDWKGRVPTDLFGGSQFPPIGADAYPVTLTGHGFFWLELLSASETTGPDAQPAQTANKPNLPPPDQPQPLRPLG